MAPKKKAAVKKKAARKPRLKIYLDDLPENGDQGIDLGEYNASIESKDGESVPCAENEVE